MLYCHSSTCQCLLSPSDVEFASSQLLAWCMLTYCNLFLTVHAFLLQKCISHSKLSATVPAFVPGEAYTGPTFPSSLVINSNLSPLVPEFKPSVSFTSYALPYKPGHHFQYQYHQSYVKQGNTEVHQVSHQDLGAKILPWQNNCLQSSLQVISEANPTCMWTVAIYVVNAVSKQCALPLFWG